MGGGPPEGEDRLLLTIQENTRQFAESMSALTRLTQLLESRIADRFHTEKAYQIQPGAIINFSVPRGSGGLLVAPLNGFDLTNLTIRIAGVKFTIPAGSTQPQFFPLVGVESEVVLTNTSANTLAPVVVVTMSVDYAAVYAQRLPGGTSANPLYTDVTDRAARQLGEVALIGSLPSGNNVIGGVGIWDSQNHQISVIPGTNATLCTPESGLFSLAITTATTTSVKTSSGCIGTIVNAGAGASTGTLTIYNATSATGTPVLQLAAGAAQGQIIKLGVPCGTAITIVTSAADTWRVSYS